MRVLNLGSLNIDRTYEVDHFVAPKESMKVGTYKEFCGGKGLNQSIALARAGVEVFHMGCIGKDGAMLLKLLEHSNVRVDFIRQSEIPSGHAVIQINREGQNCIIIYGGANEHVKKSYIDQVLDHFENGDMFLVQNEVSNVGYAIQKAKERGLCVCFNPSPMSEEVRQYPLHMVDYFILNEIEGKYLARTESEDVQEIIKNLKEDFPTAAFVLTLGENGSYYFDEFNFYYQKIFPMEVVDTTGAGDTFTGYFLAGIAKGKKIQTILCEASMASAISVGRRGAASGIPWMDEIKLHTTSGQML